MENGGTANGGKPLSRRAMLAALGAAGVAAAAGTLWPQGAQAASADGLFYNVKDYGARGTGRYDQNDAPSIQTAVDAAAAAGGGTVVLPPGKYIVSSSINLKSNVRIVGSGMGVTVLKVGGSSAFSVFMSMSDISLFSVEQLTIEGTGGPTGTSNYFAVERGVLLQSAKLGRIASCEFKLISCGVYLNSCSQVTVKDCLFRNVIGADGPHEGLGVVCFSGSGHVIDGNRFRTVYKSCVQLLGCSSTLVSGNTMESCRSSAIQLLAQQGACTGNFVTGNMLTGDIASPETGIPYGIVLEGECTGNTVESNVITQTAKAAVRLEGSSSTEKDRPTGNTIAGNAISSTPTGVLVLNGDENVVSGNTIRSADEGVVVDTSGDGAGSHSRGNFAVHNGVSGSGKNAVRIGTARCEASGVFGNFGAGNAANVADNGTGTVTAGF